MSINDKLLKLSISETLLKEFLARKIIDDEEYCFLIKKLNKKNGLSTKSIFIKNELINKETNASINAEKDTI